jgi:hypothetical protein
MRPGKPARNRKKYGKCKISDERFYSYWVHGQVELISRISFGRKRAAQGRFSGNAFGYRKAGLLARDAGDVSSHLRM